MCFPRRRSLSHLPAQQDNEHCNYGLKRWSTCTSSWIVQSQRLSYVEQEGFERPRAKTDVPVIFSPVLFCIALHDVRAEVVSQTVETPVSQTQIVD